MADKKQVNFDPMNLSIQDIEDIETGFKMKFGDLMKMFQGGKEFDITQLDSRTLAAMAFMVFRVSGKEGVTVKSVKAMKLGDLMEALSEEAMPSDPTEGDSSPTSA